jgi:hypothetical protein
MSLTNSKTEQNNLFSGISLFICVVLIIGMLFSSFFIAAEQGHHCHGEDCPICQMVTVCERVLNNVSSGLFISVAFLFAVLFISPTALLSTYNLKAMTLVSQKVRLND